MARTLTPAEQADILGRHAEMERRGYFTLGADHGLTPLQLREALAWRQRMRERGYLPPAEPSKAMQGRAPERRRTRVPHWPGLENIARLTEEDRRNAMEQFLTAGESFSRLRPHPR